MIFEPISGIWLVTRQLAESTQTAAYTAEGVPAATAVADLDTESRAKVEEANALARNIVAARSRARVELMIALFEDVPALAIDIVFVAQGGLQGESGAGLSLFFVSAVISLLHSAKCAITWRQLRKATRKAMQGSPILKKLVTTQMTFWQMDAPSTWGLDFVPGSAAPNVRRSVPMLLN